MALVSGIDVIEECTSRGLVAGAFNTTNIETTMGIVEAIERVGVPTFIQVAPTNVALSGYEYIYDMVSRRLATLRCAGRAASRPRQVARRRRRRRSRPSSRRS